MLPFWTLYVLKDDAEKGLTEIYYRGLPKIKALSRFTIKSFRKIRHYVFSQYMSLNKKALCFGSEVTQYCIDSRKDIIFSNALFLRMGLLRHKREIWMYDPG